MLPETPQPPQLPPEALQYLEHVRVEKRLAARTLTLYTLDLQRLAAFAAGAGLPLLRLTGAHIRRFVAQMHAAGRSGRGIALILSGWRGFYAWAARQGLVPHNPVQDVRAPKAPKPLPKALPVDEAVRLAEHEDSGADPWLEARDAAIVELLYGCGLRVGELVGLDVAPSPAAHQQGRGWIDLQAGTCSAKAASAAACPWAGPPPRRCGAGWPCAPSPSAARRRMQRCSSAGAARACRPSPCGCACASAASSRA